MRQTTVAGYVTLDCLFGIAPDEAIPSTLPLVIALHGRGGQPEVPSGIYRRLHHPFRMVMPRGPHPLESGGYAWLTVRTIEGRTDVLSRDAIEQADALMQWLDAVAASEPLPTPDRVILVGFSQGGILTYTLAVRHGARFSVAMPLAGWLPPPARPARFAPGAPPIYAMHGTDDAAVPIGLADESVAALARAGFFVELRRYPGVGHTLSHDEERLLRWRLDRLLDPRR